MVSKPATRVNMKSNKIALTEEQLEMYRHLSTCRVANAIETFHERLRNEGFAGGNIRCLFPKLAPMIGHAATIKCSRLGSTDRPANLSRPQRLVGLYPFRPGSARRGGAG